MSKRAEELAVRIHNTALRKAEKYASEHGMSVLEEVSYGRGFKAGAITGYEQAEKDLGWISVKDRLPEENKWVFVCVDMQGVPQCVGLGYLKDGVWRDDENDNGFCVDYWMEIPKFKEEEV